MSLLLSLICLPLSKIMGLIPSSISLNPANSPAVPKPIITAVLLSFTFT